MSERVPVVFPEAGFGGPPTTVGWTTAAAGAAAEMEPLEVEEFTTTVAPTTTKRPRPGRGKGRGGRKGRRKGRPKGLKPSPGAKAAGCYCIDITVVQFSI